MQDKSTRSKPPSPKRSRKAGNGESRDGHPDSTTAGKEESGSVESIPVESKTAESKPTESKPAASNPAKSKSAESRPVESKPVESQPVEPSAVESSPADAPVKPVEKNVKPEIIAEAFSADTKKPENKVSAEERKTPGTSSGAESLGNDPLN